MGPFDLYFEQKGWDAEREFIVSQAIDNIGAIKDIYDLKKCIDAFGKINHPCIQYVLAYKCVDLDMMPSAKMHFFLSAKHGFKPESEYFNSVNSVFIGSSITYLLTQFPLVSNGMTLFKALVLAYLHLSKAIYIGGNSNHETRRTRFSLLNDIADSTVISKEVHALFYLGFLGDKSGEVFKIADLVKSASGYLRIDPPLSYQFTLNAELFKASLGASLVNGIEANRYSLEGIAEFGEDQHFNVFNRMEPHFAKGIFNVTESEFLSLLA